MDSRLLVCVLGWLHSAILSDGSLFPKLRAMGKKPVVCETIGCKERAQLIISSIDESKDPCDDFYSFVCGKTTTEMEGDGYIPDHLEEQWQDYENKVMAILDSLPNVTEAKSATEKLALAYQVCAYSDLPLENEVDEVKLLMANHGWSGWPIIKSSQNDTERFKTFEEFLLSTSLSGLLVVSLARRPGMTSLAIKLEPKVEFLASICSYSDHEPANDTKIANNAAMRALTSTETLQYAPEKDITGLFKTMVVQRALREFAPRKSHSRADTVTFTSGLSEIVADAMITVLALFSPTSSNDELKGVYDTLNIISKRVQELPKEKGTVLMKTIKEVESLLPGFPLLQSLNKYLHPAGVTLQEEDTVLLKDFETIMAYIKYLMTEPPDDVFNSIGLINTFGIMSLTSERFRQIDAVKKYLETLAGPLNRKILCRKSMSILFPDIISRLYVKRHFDSRTRPKARHILNMIGKAYYNRIGHIPWVDFNTWKLASKKLWNLKPHVVHCDSLTKPDMIEMLYNNITTLKRSSTFITFLEPFRIMWFMREYSMLHQDFRESSFKYPYIPRHSFYSLGPEYIDIDASMLGGKYFHQDLPIAANLGAIGVVMANIITNKLYYKDNEFNENGRMIWWSNTTLDAFVDVDMCLTKQYDRMCEPFTKLRLNGTMTAYNNMADNAAVKIAFEALRNMLSEKEDMALPGLEKLPPEKLFFISFALPMCQNVTFGSMKKTIEMSNYAPHRYRVNVPLMNMMEFSAVFQCKRGSLMRPLDKERCSLW